MFKKVISLALSVVFSLQTCGFAQVGQLNLSGYLGQGGGAPALDRFRSAHLRYFSYEPDSDNFQILLDKADEKDLSDIQVKDKADELMRYFRIGLSLPNEKFWVNLRPDAPEQIIDPELERTDIGKIMLEADLQLKKDTASFTSPQTKEGKEYWDKLYQKAGELFGTENITIPTITRPWIVPGEIIVRESGDSAYIYKAALKVMLEEDYLTSRGGSRTAPTYQQYAFSDPRLKELNQYSTQLIRELIIPKLTKEVNRARRYAGLRQVFYSLILARWFKQSQQNTGAPEPQGTRAPVNENNTLTKLIDSGSLTNLTSKEPWSKDTYYQGYKNSFEQGEYNLSETVRTPTGQVIRRYISGGISAGSALTVDNHYNIPGVEKNPSGTNAKLFKYMSGSDAPVAIASGSPLIADKEIPERLKGWPVFESIEKLMRNHGQGVTYFIPTNILIGKTVCTTIQVIMDWVKVDEDGEDIIKYWIVEFKENAKSKEPLARIKVYSNDIFSAETPKNLSDTERNPIVAKMLSRPFFLDKSQMAELEKKRASSALTLEILSERLNELIRRTGKFDITYKNFPYDFDSLINKSSRFNNFSNQWDLAREYRAGIWDICKAIKAKISSDLPDQTKQSLQELLAKFQRLDKYLSIAIDVTAMDFTETQISAFLVSGLAKAVYNAQGEKWMAVVLPRDILMTGFYDQVLIQPNFDEYNRMKGYMVRLGKLYYEEHDLKIAMPPAAIINFPYNGLISFSLNSGFEKYLIADADETFEKELFKIRELLLSSSALMNVSDNKRLGAVDFRSMNMLIQPMGSFSGLDFSPVRLSSSALEAMDLDKGLENIKQMASSSMLPSPQRLKEYISACIFKGKIGEKADDFILSMLDVFQLQAEEGIESAALEREAVVLADTRCYVLPEKRLAASNGYSLN